MELINAIASMPYDRNLSVWAELIDGRFQADSDARYGQKCFENGGLLDDKHFVCNGETAGDFLADWYDDEDCLVDGWFEELLEVIQD